MKFDGVALYRAFPTHEPASKVIGHNNHHMTVNMWKADAVSVMDGKHDIASPIDSKSCEETDPFQYGNSPGRHCYADIENSMEGDQDEGEVHPHPGDPTVKIGLAEKETDFYTEKTVTEIELPETIACFTDGACHTVKDICIDEVHSLEKLLVESNEGQRISSRFSHSVSNGSYNLTKEMTNSTKEMTDDTGPISHGLKSSSLKERSDSVVDKDDADQCSSGSLLTGGGKLDTVALSVDVISEKLLPLQFDTDSWKVDSSSCDCNNDQMQSIDHQKIDQGMLEEGNSTAKAAPSAFEVPIQSCGTKGGPANGEIGVITFHFDSGVATASGSEGSKENTYNQQSGQTRVVPKSEEVTLDGATASARSSVYHGYGDGPASLSGPIASSGHIPYSGSISLRSDSSTTSARSFAFPVLQSEWNCSPVKMAKADRRRLRKHRGWRMGLLCCRF